MPTVSSCSDVDSNIRFSMWHFGIALVSLVVQYISFIIVPEIQVCVRTWISCSACFERNSVDRAAYPPLCAFVPFVLNIFETPWGGCRNRSEASFETLGHLLKETFPIGNFPVAVYVSYAPY